MDTVSDPINTPQEPISKDTYRSFKYLDDQQNPQELIPSEEQYSIITSALNQDMKILACAGSGKTTTLVMRLKFLLDNGVSPDSILVCTFNVEAGKDIQDRTLQIIGSQASEITICNIDKFVCKIFNEQIKGTMKIHFGIDPNLTEINGHFKKYLKTEKGIELMKKYQYFFFDEFQDVSESQYEVLLSFHTYGCHLTVVGDDSQNIYSWRNSKIDIIQSRIDQDIQTKTGKTLSYYTLSTNYRSTKPIIEFANQIFKQTRGLKKINMTGNRAMTTWMAQKKPLLQGFKNPGLQNTFIIEQIKSKISQQHCELKDIAILSPSKKSLQQFEEQLEQYNQNQHYHKNRIPYVSFHEKNTQEGNNGRKQAELSEEDLNRVVVSSIHKVKGLEWKIVFILGLNDASFPQSFLRGDNETQKEKMEECYRLFYVGCTRAADELYFLVNYIYDKNRVCRFFQNIPIEFYDMRDIDSYYLSQRTYTPYPSGSRKINEIISDLDISDWDTINRLVNFILPIENEDKLDGVPQENAQQETQIQEHQEEQQEQSSNSSLSQQICRILKISEISLHPKLILEDYSIQGENLQISLKHYVETYFIRTLADSFGIKEGYTFQNAEILLNRKTTDKSILQISQKILEVPIFKQSYQRFQNRALATNQIPQDIYQVSKLNQIIEGVTKVLYKNDFTKLNSLGFSDNTQAFVKHIQEQKHNKISLNVPIRLGNQYEAIKIMADSVIYDIDGSYFPAAEKEIFLKVLAYASWQHLNDSTVKIKKIVLYNPLIGILKTYDISQWNSEKELTNLLRLCDGRIAGRKQHNNTNSEYLGKSIQKKQIELFDELKENTVKKLKTNNQ